MKRTTFSSNLSKNKEIGVSQVVLGIKNLPANAGETQVQSLGWEDPLQKRMATHSSMLAWEIPWTEEPSGLQSMGLKNLQKEVYREKLEE